MAEGCRNGKYLILHFLNGSLVGTKVSRTWRGAQMSKQNHERTWAPNPILLKYSRLQFDAATRILPLEAVLALEGLEKPDTDLNTHDLAMLKTMGIE